MSAATPSIVWFRQDLRLADNPALTAALARGAPVVPVFVLDEDTEGMRAMGGASRWWLHHSLSALADDLAARGCTLVLRRGAAARVIATLADETGAGAAFWNRCYEPGAVARDTAIKSALQERGIVAESFNGSLLMEPWALKTGQGGPYKVFTPFWKRLRAQYAPPPPETLPERLSPVSAVKGDSLDDWALLPTAPDWAAGIREAWSVGEDAARASMAAFLDNAVADYPDDRDRPDRTGTSRLSPHLHWGEISPHRIWCAAAEVMDAGGSPAAGAESLLRELAWRDFNHHLLFHFPDIARANWKPAFDAFEWRDDPEGLTAWQRGRTGYPLVDAGMRELWQTGWMHNRVRMVAGSFLVKDLLIDWRAGEAWFWDTLVDADLANNAGNWQWVAGSGADAAPFFRIFNPVSQGEKFDPGGAYVRQWVPELAGLPDKWIHKPWVAPDDVLADAGVRLDADYPAPILDHKAARQRALDAYAQIKGGT
jgi:deoxyribodipyrimidine photo-lyase